MFLTPWRATCSVYASQRVEVQMSEDKRIEALEQRVSYLERETSGEKAVTRHILLEARANSDLLALLNTRVGNVEGKLESLEKAVHGLEKTVHGLEKKVDAFPAIVADVVREVLRERKV
jgi:chaperonin cofactor prefoldin